MPCTTQCRSRMTFTRVKVAPQNQGGLTVAAGSRRERQVHTSRLVADSGNRLSARDAVNTSLITDRARRSLAWTNTGPPKPAVAPALPAAIFTPFWNSAYLPEASLTLPGKSASNPDPRCPAKLSLNGVTSSSRVSPARTADGSDCRNGWLLVPVTLTLIPECSGYWFHRSVRCWPPCSRRNASVCPPAVVPVENVLYAS